MSENRRRFHRIQLDCTATVEVNGHNLATQLIDISLNGALLSRPLEWSAELGTPCVVKIALDPEQAEIRMEGKIAHMEDERIGVHCAQLDIESAGYLRRVVELNLGDAELLNREFSALI